MFNLISKKIKKRSMNALLYMHEKTEMINYKNTYIQSYAVRIILYKESIYKDLRIVILENITYKI